MWMCKLLGCSCNRYAEEQDKLRRDVKGLAAAMQVWVLARGELQENDQKMLFAIRHLTSVGLDSADIGSDTSYPDIEHVDNWGK